MWHDNETDKDLLGFDIHAELIKTIVTDQEMLPISIGLFGDWGSGKSSVMKMLENKLQELRLASANKDGIKNIIIIIGCIHINILLIFINNMLLLVSS